MTKCFSLEVTCTCFIKIWCKKFCWDYIKKWWLFLCSYCPAQGYGAKGHNDYQFCLEFSLPVKPKVCVPVKKKKKRKKVPDWLYIIWVIGSSDYVQVSYKSTQRQVNITVQKEQRGWWQRLCAQERKPVFLAPDFDRWLDESDAELEIKEKVWLKFSHCWNLLSENVEN